MNGIRSAVIMSICACLMAQNGAEGRSVRPSDHERSSSLSVSTAGSSSKDSFSRPTNYASFIIVPGKTWGDAKIILETQDRYKFPDKRVQVVVKDNRYPLKRPDVQASQLKTSFEENGEEVNMPADNEQPTEEDESGIATKEDISPIKDTITNEEAVSDKNKETSTPMEEEEEIDMTDNLTADSDSDVVIEAGNMEQEEDTSNTDEVMVHNDEMVELVPVHVITMSEAAESSVEVEETQTFEEQIQSEIEAQLEAQEQEIQGQLDEHEADLEFHEEINELHDKLHAQILELQQMISDPALFGQQVQQLHDNFHDKVELLHEQGTLNSEESEEAVATTTEAVVMITEAPKRPGYKVSGFKRVNDFDKEFISATDVHIRGDDVFVSEGLSATIHWFDKSDCVQLSNDSTPVHKHYSGYRERQIKVVSPGAFLGFALPVSDERTASCKKGSTEKFCIGLNGQVRHNITLPAEFEAFMEAELEESSELNLTLPVSERYHILKYGTLGPNASLLVASTDIRETLDPHPCQDNLKVTVGENVTRITLQGVDICQLGGIAFNNYTNETYMLDISTGTIYKGIMDASSVIRNIVMVWTSQTSTLRGLSGSFLKDNTSILWVVNQSGDYPAKTHLLQLHETRPTSQLEEYSSTEMGFFSSQVMDLTVTQSKLAVLTKHSLVITDLMLDKN